MKSQLIIFGLFVVFTLVHGRNTFGREVQFEGKDQHREIRQNDLRDTELDASMSSEEIDEKRRWNFVSFFGPRRGREESGHHHRFAHNEEWHKRHGIPMPSENSNDGNTCHHRHHHHRTTTKSTTTTTVTPTTTTTTTTPSYFNNEIDFRNVNEFDDVEMINRDP